MFDQFEDHVRLKKQGERSPFISRYQDFRIYTSSVTPDVKLAANVIKPARPGYMLVQLHGWHMSMPAPIRREQPLEHNRFLIVQVDMRGRAFSTGRPDCNGNELIDIYDAVQWAKREYASYLIDPSIIYLEGGSGGGGNVLAAVGKFPDLFAAATAYYGISDYALWYEQDQTGEFRDELDIWVGCTPAEDTERYRARSGLELASNLLTPLYMAHGDRDIRVPAVHSELYVQALKACGKQGLVRYDVLKGVGGYGHLDGITDKQRLDLESRSEINRWKHHHCIALPSRGRLVVGGYVYTKKFQVTLSSNDQLADLEYDLSRNVFILRASRPYPYVIRTNDGQRLEGICQINF